METTHEPTTGRPHEVEWTEDQDYSEPYRVRQEQPGHYAPSNVVSGYDSDDSDYGPPTCCQKFQMRAIASLTGSLIMKGVGKMTCLEKMNACMAKAIIKIIIVFTLLIHLLETIFVTLIVAPILLAKGGVSALIDKTPFTQNINYLKETMKQHFEFFKFLGKALGS